jgi:hypothetical protein
MCYAFVFLVVELLILMYVYLVYYFWLSATKILFPLGPFTIPD